MNHKKKLENAMQNYKWKNTNTVFPEVGDTVLAIIADDPPVGVIGKLVRVGGPYYMIDILQSVGPVDIHQDDSDDNTLCVNSFEIYEVIK